MTDEPKPYMYQGPDLKPGDTATFKIGDKAYADIVTEIKSESPLFTPVARPSRWRRLLYRLRLASPPALPPALPTVTVTTMGDPIEIGSPGWQARMDAKEHMLGSCLAALAAIEKIENSDA